MATSVWIVGRSGSGKSTSYLQVKEKIGEKTIEIEGLDPSSNVVINCDDKALPGNITDIYNNGVNYFEDIHGSALLNTLKELNKNPGVKSIVIDTWSRWASNIVDDPSFSQGDARKKWMVFAQENILLFNAINRLMRKDIIVYMLAHPTEYTDENGILSLKIATQGKMLDNRSVESFSTIVLFTQKQRVPSESDKYTFRTNNFATSKSPLGMFVEENIPNDLGIVDKQIRAKLGL
jgi:hypothetical protein